MDTGVQKEKEYQRAAGIARRCALSVQQRTAFDAAIADRVLALPMFAAARTILSYCAVGGEVDPAAIDAAAFRLGKAVAYPLCLAEGHMEAALPAAGRVGAGPLWHSRADPWALPSAGTGGCGSGAGALCSL